MGGLYNLLHGVQQDAPVLWDMLGLVLGGKPLPGFRLRDAWLNPDGTRIIVLTRNGGGNREHYADDDTPAGKRCPCVGCAIQFFLPMHPYYVRDWDDDYDATYAYVEFTVPPSNAEWCKNLATGEVMPSLKERFNAVIEEIGTMTREQAEQDPRVKPILDQLKSVIADGDTKA